MRTTHLIDNQLTAGMITTGTITTGRVSAERIRHRVIGSPLGPVTLVGTDQVLTGLYLTGDRRSATATGHGPRVGRGFEPVVDQLAEYFAGTRTDFRLELRPGGDAFAQRVWALLRRIPYGQTRSYGQLARQLGAPGLARAVGRANGANPIAILIPCHRVVGSTGSLTGYAGGIEAKRRLLDHERPPLAG